MPESPFSDEPSHCPHCGDPHPIPLLYEPSSDEMRTAAQLGHIALADTPRTDPPSEWVCRDPGCSVQF